MRESHFTLAPLAVRPASGGEVPSARSASGTCASACGKATSHWLRSPCGLPPVVKFPRLAHSHRKQKGTLALTREWPATHNRQHNWQIMANPIRETRDRALANTATHNLRNSHLPVDRAVPSDPLDPYGAAKAGSSYAARRGRLRSDDASLSPAIDSVGPSHLKERPT